MFLAWRGKGFLVPIILIGSVILSIVLRPIFFGSLISTTENAVVNALAFIVAGVGVFFLARWFNRRPARIMIDAVTGARVEMREPHELYYIPIRFWPYILILIGTGGLCQALLFA